MNVLNIGYQKKPSFIPPPLSGRLKFIYQSTYVTLKVIIVKVDLLSGNQSASGDFKKRS